MSEWSGKTVVVLGGSGFLGQRLVHFLKATDARFVIALGTAQLDLRERNAFKMCCYELGLKPDIVFHLAANVGGIGATSRYPVEFLYDNTLMGLNALKECYEMGVAKLIVAGSVCAYAERAPVPMVEENLWIGYPEPTNAAYGTAKRTVLVAQDAYREEYGFPSVHVLMANLYGPGQSTDPHSSHVIPAIISKIKTALEHQQDSVELWGTGNVSRDFLYVDDAARAFVAIAEKYRDFKPINIGSGDEISILGVAHKIASLMDYPGRFLWDAARPDGQPRRCLRIWRVHDTTGWKPTVTLDKGLLATIEWYLNES